MSGVPAPTQVKFHVLVPFDPAQGASQAAAISQTYAALGRLG
jgi:hypothetical protein